VSEDVTGEMEALAAEYVLGTLDFDARNAAANLRVQDPQFAAKVKIWERRLGELHLMVEPVEPDPEIWSRIRAKLPATKPPEPISPVPEPVVTLPEHEPKPEPEREETFEAALPPAAPVTFAAAERQADQNEPAEPKPAEPKFETEAAIAPVPEPASAGEAASAPAADTSFSDATPGEAQADTDRVPSFNISAAAASAIADALAAPEPAAAITAVPANAKVASDAKLRMTERHLVFWRAATLVMALALLSAAALVSLWRYWPERVPAELRPLALMHLVGIAIDASVPQRKPAPPESRFDE
jgi:anti-sigma-K factor RskA